MTDSNSSAQARPPGALSRVWGATLNYGVAAYLPRLLNFFLLPVAFAVMTPNQFGLLEVCVVSAVLLETVSRLSLPRTPPAKGRSSVAGANRPPRHN